MDSDDPMFDLEQRIALRKFELRQKRRRQQAAMVKTTILQKGALSCWHGDGTFNIQFGETILILTAEQAKWIAARITEGPKLSPGDIGQAALAVEAARKVG